MSFSFDPDDEFLTGACHMHAIAAVRAHGGHFAILYDHGDAFGTDEDGEDIPTVWHVWSVHETAQGPVARDVTGDIPIDQVGRHAAILFEEVDIRIEYGDAHVDAQCSLEELMNLCSADMPLAEVTEDEIARIMALDSVTDPPGSRRIALPEPQDGPEP